MLDKNFKKKKIGIITFQGVINNGAILQAKGLLEKLSEKFPEREVKIINYLSPSIEVYEFLKCFIFFNKKPLFYLKRYLKFKIFLHNFLNLGHKIYFGSLKNIISKMNLEYQDDDLIITGSDCIWRLSKNVFFPKFPNIYWLPSEIRAKKISYAASAFESDQNIFLMHKEKIKSFLSHYQKISVRDENTSCLINSLGLNKEIIKVPDPAFYYKINNTGVKEKLERKGVDFSKPTLALLTSYKDKKIEEIILYFRNNGFQIIGLSMYNPLVDWNFGDEITPDEWAEVFKYFTFCITDRFHGVVFCIKNKTPFIAIEQKSIKKEASKKYQVLKDFNLLDCYADIYLENVDIISKYKKVFNNWPEYNDIITKNLEIQIEIGNNFIEKLRNIS